MKYLLVIIVTKYHLVIKAIENVKFLSPYDIWKKIAKLMLQLQPGLYKIT